MKEIIRVKQYKCFKDEISINPSSLVNLIIGRNNCGKTTLTDIVEFAYSTNNDASSMGETSFEFVLDDVIIKDAFRSNLAKIDPVSGKAQPELFFGNKLKNKRFVVQFDRFSNHLQVKQLDLKQQTIVESKGICPFNSNDWERLANSCLNTIKQKSFSKIAAERDILPELEWKGSIDSNGNGITTFIDRYLNIDGFDYSVVSNDLLNDLNVIMDGENKYTGITTVIDSSTKKKTICLIEDKRRIKLNEMGSGLKTIIFVLLVLLLNKHRLRDTIFVFEELENNLHPEIQRRLFNYIYDFCITNKCQVFLTSHSHVAINCFYGKENASIFHVFKGENNSSKVDLIESYMDKASLLDDLGVKASDLFQSNGIIWVEGPSDRVYIRKWIELFDKNLIENEHYTFLYYGGKVLSHYTADEKNQDELINLLITNRHSIVVMDHDEKDEQTSIRKTKERVKNEVEAKGQLVWITKGKEIENYVDVASINKMFKLEGEKAMKQVKPFEKFSEYIDCVDSSFSQHKVDFAVGVSKFFDSDSLKVLDLDKNIEEIVKRVREWNNLKQ